LANPVSPSLRSDVGLNPFTDGAPEGWILKLSAIATGAAAGEGASGYAGFCGSFDFTGQDWCGSTQILQQLGHGLSWHLISTLGSFDVPRVEYFDSPIGPPGLDQGSASKFVGFAHIRIEFDASLEADGGFSGTLGLQVCIPKREVGHLVVWVGRSHVFELGDTIIGVGHDSGIVGRSGRGSRIMQIMSDLSTTLAGVELSGPIVSAAGTGGTATELADVLDLRELGAVTTKSITPESRTGNAPMRVADVPVGMMNAIGLANKGLDSFMTEIEPTLSSHPTVFIGSVAGHCLDDYVQVAGAFDAAESLPIIELNLSCPNSSTGRQFTEGPADLAEVIAAVRSVVTRTKLFVKLPLLFEHAADMAGAAVDAGADGLTMINTIPSLSIDVRTRRPRLGYGPGGLSGPAIHLPAVGMVRRVYDAVARDAGIPIIGLGGVRSWEQAAAFILAGASAVGMGTTLFHNPRAPRRILRGLDRWVQQQGCASLHELIGAMEST
jgi:dihydroorotate dehydrogenase (NAD+) catalytic subunit